MSCFGYSFLLFPKRYWFSFPSLFFFPFSFISHLSSPSPFSLLTIGFYSFLNKFAISDYLGKGIRRKRKEERGKREERTVFAEHLLSFSPLLLVKQPSFGAVQLKMFSPYPCHLHLEGFFSFYFFFSLFLSFPILFSSPFFLFFCVFRKAENSRIIKFLPKLEYLVTTYHPPPFLMFIFFFLCFPSLFPFPFFFFFFFFLPLKLTPSPFSP